MLGFLCSPPLKIKVSSFHWHLALSLAFTADSMLGWQVAGRATLLFRSSKAQSYKVPLAAATGAVMHQRLLQLK